MKNKILQTLQEKIKPVIDVEIAAREECQRKIGELQNKAREYRAEATKSIDQAKKLSATIPNLLLEGGDVHKAQKQIDKLEGEAALCLKWADQLEEEVLPGIREDFEIKQSAAASAIRKIIHAEIPIVSGQAGEAFLPLFGIFIDWFRALQAIATQTNVSLYPVKDHRLTIHEAIKTIPQEDRERWARFSDLMNADFNCVYKGWV